MTDSFPNLEQPHAYPHVETKTEYLFPAIAFDKIAFAETPTDIVDKAIKAYEAEQNRYWSASAR